MLDRVDGPGSTQAPATPGQRRRERCGEPAPAHHSDASLQRAIELARDALCARQQDNGSWCFELEADCTIPAEYVLMMHFMDEIEPALERKIAAYLRAHQNADGGWPLYWGGKTDLSCTVKVYYALKAIGDDPDAPHMARARRVVLQQGGAARANVFTRIMLAQFAQIPWRGVPFIPVEIVLLPRWFLFHINKVSYWSRTVMVPLSILFTLRATARNPRDVHVRELFTTPPEKERNYFPVRSPLNRLFLSLERIARLAEPLIPGWLRRFALDHAERWFAQRLNADHGLGGIFPAMVNAYEALAARGYAADHPYRVHARSALRRLLVEGSTHAYCQPCLSPVWDTALSAHALLEEGGADARTAARLGLEWLATRQVKDTYGDWKDKRPTLRGGGWPFEYANDHYPDLDDTAVVAWAMALADPTQYADAITRAADWLIGMQSKNGGFASFDVDNNHYYLNEIPFADHGALLDPPTSDVSARCLALLGGLWRPGDRQAIARCVAYLRSEQESTGPWFGRWGTNYIYGTWSVLVGLREAGEELGEAYARRAVDWLKSVQRPDGGWGESNDSYDHTAPRVEDCRRGPSTSFQTAWALLALMAAGDNGSDAVVRGVDFLLSRQNPDGSWADPGHTCPGFPRVFYLKYHGYSLYFPLWALARYRALQPGGSAG